jgi:sec-independent protein translocase protein TatB
MFDIGWSELLVVAVVAIVVIGPRDLPAAMRTLGRTLGAMRRMAADFRSQFDDAMRAAELDDLRREIAGLRDAARGIVQQVDVGTMAQTELDNIQASLEAKEATLEAKEAEAADDQPDLFALPEPAPEPEEPDLFDLPAAQAAPAEPAVPAAAAAEVPAVEPAPAAPDEPIALPVEKVAAAEPEPAAHNGAAVNGHATPLPAAEPEPTAVTKPRPAAARKAAPAEAESTMESAIDAVPESPAHGG